MAARLVIGSMILGSSALAVENPARAASSAAVARSDAATNASLAALAKVFAGAVVDTGFRRIIHDSVAERFDGDTDVLWKTLATKPSVQGALAKVAARRSGATTFKAGQTVNLLASRVPRLQVAVPVNFEKWNPASYAPLVAYMPAGVEDTTLKTVTAYDAAGRTFQLDAQVAPRQPVIVLGLNERTDDSGALLSRQQTVSSPPGRSGTEASGAGLAAAVTAYQVRMVGVKLIDDHEPWTAGDAEISLKARSRGCSGVEYADPNWEELNNSGDAWIRAGTGGERVLGSTTCDVVFYWWEDDGGAFDFTLGYGNFSLGVKMDNGDDLIGGSQLAYHLFQGGGTGFTDITRWSSLDQVTD